MNDRKNRWKQEDRHVPSHSKLALAALAFALSCAPVFAQGNPPDDPPAAPDAGGPGGGMRRGGPGGRDGGNWGRGRDGQDWGRRDGHGFGRGRGMGMRGRGGMEGRERMLGRLLSNPEIRDAIGVTADQAAKIRQQESDFRKTEIRGRADLEVKQIDLRDLMSTDKPDRAAIDAKLTEISTARLALEKSSVTFRLNSRDALTADQRTKLRDLMRTRRGQNGGPAPGGPRGGRAGRRGGQAPPPPADGTKPPTGDE
jgi:Spy/CpxP family protein refolding chaperone